MDKIKIAGKQTTKKAVKIVGDRAKYAASQALQNQMNKATSLVNQSLNKALNAVAGTKGIKPPTNVYDSNKTTQQSRFFYDVRGDLADFAGNSITGLI